jgi:hypothetical protein
VKQGERASLESALLLSPTAMKRNRTDPAPASERTIEGPPMRSEYLGDDVRSEGFGDEVKALGAGRSFWENRAALARQREQMHVGYSDAAGAARRARSDTLAGLGFLATLVYAAVVALVIAALNLPVGRTWLAAAVIALLAFVIARMLYARFSQASDR